MQAPAPRVSVVCPAFNRSAAITQTLNSVRAQSVRDWELIVISDGSTDDTDTHVRAAAAADPRIRLTRTAHHGHPAEPRNIALAQARGNVIAYLDHDDQWHPGHLAAVLTAIDSGATLVATGFELRAADGTTTAVSQPYEMCWHPEFQILGAIFEPSRVAHRRGVAERVGGWRAGAGMEDWDLWLRLTDAGERFTTVAHPTTVILDDASTRRHRIPALHHVPVAAFDDPARARSALRAVADRRHAAALRAAHRKDCEAWLERLAASGDFVEPLGARGDVLPALVDAMADTAPHEADLVLTRRGRSFVLAKPVRCADAAHAERIARLVRTVHSRLALLLRELADSTAAAVSAGAR
ncbi:glycosyltransferase family 2 protein [Streptomyces sp. NPDC029674]|uniref:glycosyltransferase family 2 protein n=1 Tax=Streptomyces sp. NPDC029674 TaxID=3365297 RepID=UPI00384EA4DF